MPLSGRVFLIAGATSGIGLALSREVIRRGAHVFGIGRRSEHPLEGVEGYESVTMDLEEKSSFESLRRLVAQNSGSRMSYVRLAVGLEQLATSNS